MSQQDLVVDCENASEFVSTILDAPGAPKPSDPPCKPQAKRKAGENARWNEVTMPGWLLCFPRPKSRSSDFIRTDNFLKDKARHS